VRSWVGEFNECLTKLPNLRSRRDRVASCRYRCKPGRTTHLVSAAKVREARLWRFEPRPRLSVSTRDLIGLGNVVKPGFVKTGYTKVNKRFPEVSGARIGKRPLPPAHSRAEKKELVAPSRPLPITARASATPHCLGRSPSYKTAIPVTCFPSLSTSAVSKVLNSLNAQVVGRLEPRSVLLLVTCAADTEKAGGFRRPQINAPA
jgi:hypothetical protein